MTTMRASLDITLMTLRLFVRASSRQLHRYYAPMALCVLAGAVACATKTTLPAPVAAPPTAGVPTVMQTCPDPTDGPSIVINAVDEAHRALVANPTTPLPPPCVLAAFARIASPLPDSLNTGALALATELRRRGSNQRELLATEIVLLARMRRYADASASYARLVALDSQPSIEVTRLAIAAAHQRSDTATLVRILARTASQPGAGPAMAAELNVLRQVSALRAAINEARGLIRQNPKYVGGYPSLVGNFGTLGMADSVVAYIRHALAQSVPRATLSPSVENFATATLRHATLYGSTYGWDAQIAAATRVDSALTSPATKFLVASLLVQSAEPAIAEISSQVSETSLSPRPTDAAARDQVEQRRAAGCRRIVPISQRFDAAQTYLRNGGDRVPAGGVQQLAAALAAGQSTLTTLQERCAKSR